MLLLVLPMAFAADPTPHIDVEAPWILVSADAKHIALRIEGTAHGVRIERGARPGINPVLDGHTLQASKRNPFIAVPWPEDGLSAIWVENQSIDLVVRLQGGPLAAHSDHPKAPTDAALTQVRVRLRDDSLRLVVTGLPSVRLPANSLSVSPQGEGARLEVDGWSVHLSTEAPAYRSELGTRIWIFDPRASLDALRPYPRTVIDVSRTSPPTPQR